MPFSPDEFRKLMGHCIDLLVADNKAGGWKELFSAQDPKYMSRKNWGAKDQIGSELRRMLADPNIQPAYKITTFSQSVENEPIPVVRADKLSSKGMFPFASSSPEDVEWTNDYSKCLFVSHPWGHPDNPDPKRNQQHALTKWLDEFTDHIAGLHFEVQERIRKRFEDRYGCLANLFVIPCCIPVVACVYCSYYCTQAKASSITSLVDGCTDIFMDMVAEQVYRRRLDYSELSVMYFRMRLMIRLAKTISFTTLGKDHNDVAVKLRPIIAQNLYMWVDFSCLPQKSVKGDHFTEEDRAQFKAGLRQIDLLCYELPNITIIEADSNFEKRAWCVYEYINSNCPDVHGVRVNEAALQRMKLRMFQEFTDDSKQNLNLMKNMGLRTTNGDDLVFIAEKLTQLVLSKRGNLEQSKILTPDKFDQLAAIRFKPEFNDIMSETISFYFRDPDALCKIIKNI